MKEIYQAPDLEVVSIIFQEDALSPSTYTPDPQNPVREGDTEEMDF